VAIHPLIVAANIIKKFEQDKCSPNYLRILWKKQNRSFPQLVIPSEKKPYTYTDADVDWTDNDSRENQEMKAHPDSCPAIKNKVDNLAQYDIVFLGFPIWWYIEPNIINTFLETQDLRGKRIVPFFKRVGRDRQASARLHQLRGRLATGCAR